MKLFIFSVARRVTAVLRKVWAGYDRFAETGGLWSAQLPYFARDNAAGRREHIA